MKISKIFTSMFLSCLMLTNSFVYASYITHSDYHYADAILSRSKVIHGTTEVISYRSFSHYQISIARAEIAWLLARMYKNVSQYPYEECKFIDSSNHWATNYLNTAYELGIISGYPDGSFKPDSYITELDAVTMIIRALGYKDSAEQKGGYPIGYVKVANDLNLLRNTEIGIDKGEDKLITKGNLILLLVNALRTPMFGEENYFLWDKYGEVGLSLKKLQCTLEEVEELIYKEEHAADYHYTLLKFSIDDEVVGYQWPFDADISELIGKNVTVWIDDDGSKTRTGHIAIIDISAQEDK